MKNGSRDVKLRTQEILEMDQTVLHPWEVFGFKEEDQTVIASGDGIYVFDGDGNRLIDGPSGMWSINVGHGRREIIDAMNDQAEQLCYASPWAHPTEPSVRLAKKLSEISPGDLNRVFYTTGGSTAVDSALRFVMFYNNVRGQPEKKHILSRQDSYHGSTYLSASVSGKSRDKNWLDFETSWVHLLSSPNCYRKPEGMSEAIFCDYLVNELEEKILKVGPELVAAFIAEPILASGGVIVPPTDYHRRCLEVCRRYDVLYISDEVVTGFGRLGHWFASKEVFDIIPDIIITAKGITSSYAPLGAVLISEKLIDEVEQCENGAIFANGFTYSGHPIACAAALANINIINDDKLLEHARDVGPYFQKRLRELKELPMVGDARGVGLMGCIECVINKETDQLLEVDYDIGKRIDTHCQSLGLLVRPLVNMCVISPPIIITRGDIDKVVNILRTGIERTMADLQREGIALFNW